ncbi:hypothetical protein evm_002235 [Chilo suppressalis]|nr:hypothetical protein evm_002235 [Chilo suppressalis]
MIYNNYLTNRTIETQSMAPGKFGLFKARSREQEQPSTENLLHSSHSIEHVIQTSPIPSTSYGKTDQMSPVDFTALQIDSDNEDLPSEQFTPTRRDSESSNCENTQNEELQHQLYSDLLDDAGIDCLQDEELEQQLRYSDQLDDGDASTSCDANSLQFDATSLAVSEDLSVYCGTLKKGKRNRTKEERQLRDFDMWRASNVEVMQNLLSRSCTADDQIKWEAIATSRGLCTLTDNCTCGDCRRTKYLAGMTDGDGGLGTAPLFGAISFGCTVQ